MECSESPKQTVSHLMLNCRKWWHRRDRMLNQFKKDCSSLHKGSIKMKELFGVKATRAILRFIK